MSLRVIDSSGFMPHDFEEREFGIPFEPLKAEELQYAYHDSHRHMLYDQKGQKVDSPERELLEKAVVQAVLEDKADMIRLWSLLSDAEDDQYVNLLEKKYQVELPVLRTTTEIFKLTYLFYDSHRFDSRDTENHEKIIELAFQATQLAKRLANVELVATHLTSSDENAVMIRASQTLLAGRGYQDYLGRGVYLGILGSFRDWKQGDTDSIPSNRIFRCKVALKDTLPYICAASKSDDAEAMVNFPFEALDIHAGMEATAKPEGILDYDYEQEEMHDIQTIAPWKIEVVKKILNAETEIKTVEGFPALVLKTDEPPIVWLSLIKILKIARCFTFDSYRQYESKEEIF